MKVKSLNNEPIAIVGMSCRFPNSSNLDEFWNVLKNRKNTISEIPKERWDANKYFDLDPNVVGKTYQKHASLLKNVHHFDPLFFNISPAEATEMSPSQKLMLELAWESFEHSSIPFSAIQGKNVSVFVGSIWSDFEHFRKEKNALATLHSAVGMSNSVVANRVSFAFGFKGPSLIVDTGCSSSLVALHMACNSIRNGESEMAVVGGINHILDPDKYVELTQFGGLSKKGMCSSFDNSADGFVRGEGGGVLFLKPLSKAEEDGDMIHAVVRGTAVNNNGYNNTLPATSVEAQKDLLVTAYANAGVEPNEVDYVEAHGTGTKLGDPNEAKAIGEFFRENRKDGRKLKLGSVKTNVGHTEATAGIAGLIKVVLAMKNKQLVPNLNFNVPNTEIPFDELKIQVQDQLEPWLKNNDQTIKAGVNSFGWGGTNAHAVLEEYVAKAEERVFVKNPYLLPISAQSNAALNDYAKKYLELFNDLSETEVIDTCAAAALLKPEFDHRILFSGEDVTDLKDKITEYLKDAIEVEPISLITDEQKTVFVFPGQGGQWIGMGKELFSTNEVFKSEILKCEKAFEPYLGWLLTEELVAETSKSRLSEINVVQPMICAVQISLAKVWMELGIMPSAVVGHSMGEVSAAHIAGVLSLQDAAKVICTRSRLMSTVSGTSGAMVVTELTADEAGELNFNYRGKVSFAVNNSPKSSVLSGDKNCIDEIVEDLESRDIFCRLINVDVASHSPQMDPLLEPLKEALQDITPSNATIPFFSTVCDEGINGDKMDAEYWAKNLRNTVRFSSAMDTLLTEDYKVFVEMSSHPTLLNAINECADNRRIKVISCGSISRELPEREMIFNNLGTLYSNGFEVNWSRLLNVENAPHVVLPAYPYQREKFEIMDLSLERESQSDGGARYPLLGAPINLAGMDENYYWQSTITYNKFPFLKKLGSKSQIVAPFYMEVILEAATEIAGKDKQILVSNLKFNEKLVLPKDGRFKMQVKASMENEKSGAFHVFVRELAGNKWISAAICNVLIEKGTGIASPEELDRFYANGNENLDLSELSNTLFPVKISSEMSVSSTKFKAHPLLIDGFLEPILDELSKVVEDKVKIKLIYTGIEQFDYQSSIDYERDLHGLMVFREVKKVELEGEKWKFRADFMIANHDNRAVMTIVGLEGICQKLEVAVGEEASTVSKSRKNFLSNYQGMEYGEKTESLTEILIESVARIIKTSSNRITKGMTFKNMGLDSLMAVQLRNVLEKELKIKLSVNLFWTYPSIMQYADNLMDLLDQNFNPNPVVKKRRGNKTKKSNWFSIPEKNDAAAYRLFCFHDAGGSVSLFDGWENHFSKSDIELVLIELPGHGRRIDETPMTDLETMLKSFVPAFLKLTDKPFAFLGHSMGGLIAFEVIRELQRQQLSTPLHLFISSTPGLNAYDKKVVDYQLSDHLLIKRYPHLNMSAAASPEILQLQISILKADLQLIFNYNYKKEGLMNIPITAFHGKEDIIVKQGQIEEWEKESMSTFKIFSRPGGHDYVRNDGEFVTNIIKGEIDSTSYLKQIG